MHFLFDGENRRSGSSQTEGETLKLNHRYTWGWLIWGLLFALIEGLALFDPASGDTLSEHVWWLAENPVGWLAVAGFMAWLTTHFLTKGRV